MLSLLITFNSKQRGKVSIQDFGTKQNAVYKQEEKANGQSCTVRHALATAKTKSW